MIWRPRPQMPPLWPAMRRGVTNRCPICGCAPLFSGYLRVRKFCPHCYTALGAVPADDAPPYFTILLVGHIIVPLLLLVEINLRVPLWWEAAIFLPLTALLALALLRPITGATLAFLLLHEGDTDPPHV